MSRIKHYKKRKKKNSYWIAGSFFLFLMAILPIIFTFLSPKDKLQIALDSYYKGNYASALEKFTDLAYANNAEAQRYIGKMYFEGQGVPVDYAAAVSWFTKASEQNDPLATHNLATCYMTGMGVERDVRKALQLEIMAASSKPKFAKDNVKEQTIIGSNLEDSIYSRRQNARRNLTGDFKNDTSQNNSPSETLAVLEKFIKSSHEGKSEAAYLMGLIYSDGQEMNPDMGEAEKWFRESAHGGNVAAQMTLGMTYFAGNGVLQDFAEAFYWFNRAAENGSKDALFMLGNLYSIGYGVVVDYSKAAILYATAIEQNHSLAKCYLADLFSKGYGVFKNKDMARILCQEGFRETADAICFDIWEANNLGMTNRELPEIL